MASINGTKVNNAQLYDEGLLIQAGIDPKVLLSARVKNKAGRKSSVKVEDFKAALRIVDEQDAVNRYAWYNLPGGIDGQELERMLYFRGQLCLFCIGGKFYFMPYTLDGSIDYYGRYNRIHPIPYYEGANDKEGKTRYEAMAKILSEVKLEPQYDVVADATKEQKESFCVLLYDYTRQLGEKIIPRSLIQEPIISFEAETFPMSRTSMIASSGIKGLRVQGADEQLSVERANDQIYSSAINGNLFIPIESPVDMQEISDHSSVKSENYLMQMQAIDNFRLSLYGIENGGLFQKKAHKLEGEQEMNKSPARLSYEDGLGLRQKMCIIANSIWKLGMWCDRPSYLPEGQEEDQAQDEDQGRDDKGGDENE